MPALAITDVVAAVVTQLRDIPEVVELFAGDPEGIAAYDNENPGARNRGEATVQMPQASALVACVAAGQGFRGGMPAWRYNLVIITRLAGSRDYQTFFTALVNGTPSSGSGLSWLDESPLPEDLDPPDEIAYHERHDSQGVEYWEFSFSLAATGG